jgi:hypothetical protein
MDDKDFCFSQSKWYSQVVKNNTIAQLDRLLWIIKQIQAYIYIRLIASGIDKIHNCPKCFK